MANAAQNNLQNKYYDKVHGNGHVHAIKFGEHQKSHI